MITWTKEVAKQYMVNYHMINTTHNPSLMDVFKRIQSIQYDPLNVVGSNSDLVLQSRIKNYQKAHLQQALYQDRTLIDGWDKQMCIYQTIYYPYFSKIREHHSNGRFQSYMSYLKLDPHQFLEEVTSIIQENGPLFSSEIKLGESVKNRWGSTKPSTSTIDYLFHKGVIGIESRKNTQKKYDLIERLIDNHNQKMPITDETEYTDWLLLRRIKALGLCWNKSGVHFSGLHIENKAKRIIHLNRLLQSNLIKEVRIEGIKEQFYIPSEALDYPIELTNHISFIAPLDNLIWDRKLVKELFEFEYTWEVYTPILKRKWGYYVLPILKGSNFIGRIEFDKHRNSDPLVIKNIYYEPYVKNTKKLEADVNKALSKFAKYLGAKGINKV